MNGFQQTRSWWARSLAAVVAMGMVAACGGDDDDDGGAADTLAPTAAPTSVIAPSADTTAPSSAPSTDMAPSDGEPQSGGTLEYLVPSEPGSMDPHTFPIPAGQAGWGPVGLAVFDALAVVDPATGEVVPRLLESMESDDATVWTLTLRPGLVFSDGTPLNAAALQTNFTRIADPDTQSGQATEAQRIASMRVVDETTLEVTLTGPNAFFDYVLADALPYVISPAQIENDPGSIATDPIGAGPFLLEEWVAGSHITTTRNPDYHGEVHLDRVNIRVVPDFSQMQNSLLGGESDMALFGSGDQALELLEDDAWTIDYSRGGFGLGLFFNTQRPPFDDVRARKAVVYAIDTEHMSETVTQGTAAPARTIFQESSPFFVDGTEQPDVDPDRAQELFDELAAEGKPLSFTIMANSTGVDRAEYLQAVLSGFDNISVQIETVSAADSGARGLQGNHDAFQAGASLTSPDSLRNVFGSGGNRNFAQYDNPEVDAALDRARATTDLEKQREAYDTALQIVFEETPIALQTRISTAIAYQPDEIGGYTALAQHSPDFTKLWMK